MKPALSVIFFTVFSGTGFGLAVFAVLARLCENCAAGMSKERFLIAAALAFCFITAGMISSTLHLANPKNAWRAFSRFRTSWLSREGVFALAFYPLAALHLAAVWFDASFALRLVTGAALIACAWAVLVCTGMIYACLKTIPLWHSPLTPLSYFLYGHLAGLLVFVAIAARGESEIRPWLIGALWLIIAGIVLQSIMNSKSAPQVSDIAKAPSLNDALGFKEGRVRLLDTGHTHSTFLANEFGFRVARSKATALKIWSMLLAFIIPLLMVVIESTTSAQGWLGLAAVLCIVGLFIERWMFFAQARHVVMRYHGQ